MMKTLTAWCLCFLATVSSSYGQTCGGSSVQLVGGSMGREGRLEVCYQGQWGTVCDDYFGNVDARVACRHVGYPSDGAVAFKNAYFGAGSGNIWLDNVYCAGTESNIFSCPRAAGVGVHNCDHSEDVGIRCPPCTEGNVVFIRSNMKQGVPMLCHDGSYGTICDNGFDVNDAKVICHMLGYPTEGVQAFNGSTRFKIGYGDIFVTGLGCTGDEERLTDCPGTFYSNNHGCTHAEDAGVICPGCDDWLGNQLWSAHADTPKDEGMVQICESNGQFTAVCSKGFWCPDAKVVCRYLGFPGSNEVTLVKDIDQLYGYIRRINPFRYNCVGDESTFRNCPRTYDNTCDNPQWETVGIKCSNITVGEFNCNDGDLRFKIGNELSTGEGRIEYCFEHHWSPFCWFHDQEATVMCRQLGYTEYTRASIYMDERFGSSGFISDFKTFKCSSGATEEHLSECDMQLRGSCDVQNCPTEVGMKCFTPGICNEGEWRLVDGDIEQEGRVEVCLDGVWGTICDSSWNSIDAYVLCRQLGYDGSIAPVNYPDSQFGDGEYPIVYGGVQCKGWEKSIDDCTKFSYLSFYCLRTDIAGVRCAEDCDDGDVRLVGGNDDSEGTVEVCFAGLWGLVDVDQWDDNEAAVVCAELGLNSLGAQAVTDGSFGRPNKTMHLTNMGCDGSEPTLDECSKTVISLTDGKTTYKKTTAAGVDCQPEPPTQPPCVSMTVPLSGSDCADGDTRLVDGHSEDLLKEGRVEYCHEGLWTAFCNLDEVAASIVCRGQGFIANSKATILRGDFGSPKNYSIIQNVTCLTQTSTSLSSCTIEKTGDCVPFCPDANIGIRCFQDGVCSFGDIRLVDGYIEQEGRVEICVDNAWGVICDQGWDKTDAHVACQQLGHPELEPIVYSGSFFGDGIYPIVYSNMQCIGPENDLLNCPKDQYAAFSCPRSQVAGVLCGYDCNNGDVRLVGGSKDTEGTVEVCFDNLWGLIGDGSWDEKDASVICALAGHSPDNAVAYLGSYYGKPNKTLLLSEVQCGGDEVQLDQCAYKFYSLIEGKALIDKVQVAGVKCLPNGCFPSSVSGSQCDTGSVRLTGGALSNEGNLEYCINGTWSAFCGLEYDEASVACRQLGFTVNDYASVFTDARFTPNSNMSYFESFNCSMNATNFSNCSLSDQCLSMCENSSAIRCYGHGGCEEGTTRLVDGYLQQEGRLEICINGVWSTICDTGFESQDALVACTTLGYDVAGPVVYPPSMFGEGYGPIVYSNMMCGGYERDLRDCDKDQYPMATCARNNVVGLLCRDRCDEGDIKLVNQNGNDNEGTVLMCLDGLWSMISDQGWDSNEAEVVCRSLGFQTEGKDAKLGSFYGKVNKTLGFTNFACAGSENTLADCPNSMYTFNAGKLLALNTSVAGVFCKPYEPTEPATECSVLPQPPDTAGCTTGSVILAGGNIDSEGRLMYCYNSQWSPFCNVDPNTASVACKALKYSSQYAAIYTDGRFGNSALNYSLFVSLTCDGSESQLPECSITSTGCVPVCENNVGIRCYETGNCDEGDMRMSDGAVQQQGRLEICQGGVWSTICASGWDNTNAFVACKQLGFAAKASTAFADSLFGNGDGPIVYSDVECVGTEDNIMKCSKRVYPESSCPAGVAAGIMCADDCNDGDVMLYGGNDMTQGTVEICFDNLWGLISSSSWSNKDAEVLCRQLNLETNNPLAVSGSQFQVPKKTVHLSNVNCRGSEKSLKDCSAYKNQALHIIEGVNAAAVSCPPIPSTSISLVPTTTPPPVTQQSHAVETNTLFAMSGIFGVCAALAIIAVFGLLIFMLVVYQKRRSGTEFSTREKQILKREQRQSVADGAIPLYAAVNRNRDSMVSFSATEGSVKLS